MFFVFLFFSHHKSKSSTVNNPYKLMLVFPRKSIGNIQDDPSGIRGEHVQELVTSLIGGRNFFSLGRWNRGMSWKIPPGLCGANADNLTFRNTEKGDLEISVPLAMPQITGPGGPFRTAWKRQEKMYLLLKKVLVRGDGKIFRATDVEIVHALGDVPGDEGVSGLSGGEYVYSVKEMFRLRV